MIITGIDIETTGKLDKKHRIIEYCACSYDFNPVTGVYNPIGVYLQRLHPMRSIEKKAQEVHGISLDELEGQPVFESIGADILKTLECDLVVAHNGDSFDLPFIENEATRVGLVMPKVKSFDTMLQGRCTTAHGKVPNLRELCFAFNVEYSVDKAHGAQYDVEVMMKSFFAGVNGGFFDIGEK